MWQAAISRAKEVGETLAEFGHQIARFRHASFAHHLPSGQARTASEADDGSDSNPVIGHADARQVVVSLQRRSCLEDGDIHRLIDGLLALTGIEHAGIRSLGMDRLAREISRLPAPEQESAATRLLAQAEAALGTAGDDRTPCLAWLPFIVQAIALARTHAPMPSAEALDRLEAEMPRFIDAELAAALGRLASVVQHEPTLLHRAIAILTEPIDKTSLCKGCPREALVLALDRALEHVSSPDVRAALLNLQERVLIKRRCDEQDISVNLCTPAALPRLAATGQLYLPATWRRFEHDLPAILAALDGDAAAQRALAKAVRITGWRDAQAGAQVKANAQQVVNALALARKRGENDIKIADLTLLRSVNSASNSDP